MPHGAGSIAGYQKWISGIAQQALSLTHDSVMLKEVGSIKSEIRGEDGAELHYAKLNDHYPIDMKLYTIVKGAAGCGNE